MSVKNIFYAQSGGVTAVINATACGVIETARAFPETFGTVYAGENGILGALNENLIDTRFETPESIRGLYYTPAGAFGSCRHKLGNPSNNRAEFDRLLEIFAAHNIGYFLYNGGGDSQDTALKLSEFSHAQGFPLQCIGIPKTVDNDLPLTDNCPGFGSVAKYIAISTREAGFDVASMAKNSTKVFIMEVMGRHAGWIAASAGLAAEKAGDPPHIILFPEQPFQTAVFLEKVKKTVEQFDYCVIVVSEGIRNENGTFLSEQGTKDAFGHSQLGGVASQIASLIKDSLGYKYHYAICDYLQRAARHIASQTDLEQAYALGKAAVEFALAGKTGILPIIERIQETPYTWRISEAPLSAVANVEKKLPPHFIDESGFGITQACRQYLLPLIQGEAYPPYQNGLPVYTQLKKEKVTKRCPDFK